MFRRNRSLASILPTSASGTASSAQEEEEERPPLRLHGHDAEATMTPRELIVMNQRAMLVWLGMMYIVLLICRLGWGWTPGHQTPISTDMVAIPKQNVTIVTAYFDVPSKRPSSEYLPWIQRFLSLQDNMIIFTSNDQLPLFKNLRKNRPNTKVIGLNSLDDTSVVKDFGGMAFWERQASLDPEKYIHSKELYVIWNEKGHFLEQAMELDPFKTPFFAWVDMGYLRDSLLENQRMVRYVPKDLTPQQALFLDVRSLVAGQQYLGGGFIGGYKEGLQRWTKEYYKLLEANRDRFLGKDQPWMFESCIQNAGLCLWVQPRDTYGDAWFYMGPFLHGVSKYGTLDHVRHAWRTSRVLLFFKWLTRERFDWSMLMTDKAS